MIYLLYKRVPPYRHKYKAIAEGTRDKLEQKIREELELKNTNPQDLIIRKKGDDLIGEFRGFYIGI